MSVFRVDVRRAFGWDTVGSATSWEEAKKSADDRGGPSPAGWLSVTAGDTTTHVRKDGQVRITERREGASA